MLALPIEVAQRKIMIMKSVSVQGLWRFILWGAAIGGVLPGPLLAQDMFAVLAGSQAGKPSELVVVQTSSDAHERVARLRASDLSAVWQLSLQSLGKVHVVGMQTTRLRYPGVHSVLALLCNRLGTAPACLLVLVNAESGEICEVFDVTPHPQGGELWQWSPDQPANDHAEGFWLRSLVQGQVASVRELRLEPTDSQAGLAPQWGEPIDLHSSQPAYLLIRPWEGRSWLGVQPSSAASNARSVAWLGGDASTQKRLDVLCGDELSWRVSNGFPVGDFNQDGSADCALVLESGQVRQLRLYSGTDGTLLHSRRSASDSNTVEFFPSRGQRAYWEWQQEDCGIYNRHRVAKYTEESNAPQCVISFTTEYDNNLLRVEDRYDLSGDGLADVILGVQPTEAVFRMERRLTVWNPATKEIRNVPLQDH